MATFDSEKYSAQGAALILHEARLADLGLIVIKTPEWNLHSSGGMGTFYDLAFERRDERLSAELIRFLETEIKLPPEEIVWLQQNATYTGAA